MSNFFSELIFANLVIVGALVAVLEALKKLVPVKYIELLAVGLGALATVAYRGATVESAMNGLVIGLASCKLYDKIIDLAFSNFDMNNIEKHHE